MQVQLKELPIETFIYQHSSVGTPVGSLRRSSLSTDPETDHDDDIIVSITIIHNVRYDYEE